MPANSAPPPPEQAIVRRIARPDAQWNRRLFKAPPLTVQPPVPKLADFFESVGHPPLRR